MQTYTITFQDRIGQILVEVITADSLKEAKQICKDYYGAIKFV